jgi:hypothetical protein
MESDYIVQKVLEALQEQSAQMVMPKCGECPILALHQQIIETIREVTNAEIAVKFNMVPKKKNKCLLTKSMSRPD